MQNEPVFLPVWTHYYQQHTPAAHLFVLDHDSLDSTTREFASRLNRIPIHRAESFNHRWLRSVVERFQAFLLESYELVLITEVDEIVAPDPGAWPSGLAQFLDARSLPKEGFIRCTGYEIVHRNRDGEAALRWDRPLLQQRRYCRRSKIYSKPLLANRPLKWSLGFHRLREQDTELPEADPELLLLHLHRADYDTCRNKTLENASRRWSPEDVVSGSGYQNSIVDQAEFDRWFHEEFDDDIYSIGSIPNAWNVII